MKRGLTLTIIVLLAIGLVLIACTTSSISTPEPPEDLYQDALSEFEVSRTELNADVIRVTGQTSEQLRVPDPSFDEIGAQWESEWQFVGRKIHLMEVRFAAVAATSVVFFEELDEVVKQIIEPKIREREEERNAELRGIWRIAFDEAIADIQGVKDMLNTGQDFQNVLKAADLRGAIERNSVDGLKELSSEAKILMEDLRKLTEQGQLILES
jgi:hypothetical protein